MAANAVMIDDASSYAQGFITAWLLGRVIISHDWNLLRLWRWIRLADARDGHSLSTGVGGGIMERVCECEDPGCPACKGRCAIEAITTVRQIDMDDDKTYFRMCDACAEDALGSGAFELLR
mgnify:CR=1 FL=1